MEWVLRSPQIHSTFSNLDYVRGDGYHINENCDAALESILHNILTEDKYLRAYRRSISCGQNIKNDLIPLLLNAKEDKTIQLLIRILVNLTIPVECLLSFEIISKTDVGRHTIFEINNLLSSTKEAFTDHRATRVLIEFLKKNVDFEQKGKLSVEQCTNISNCLLLLRNLLHIPEEVNASTPNHTVQNQILWNIFSQSIDKILIKLMTIPEAAKWGVTMVQLIALLYKDQHVVTLHKHLNLWLEDSLSESSEDSESNTSPQDRNREDSSSMLTSEPTSDSSDMDASGISGDEPKNVTNIWETTADNTITADSKQFQIPLPVKKKVPKAENMCADTKSDDQQENTIDVQSANYDSEKTDKNVNKTIMSENSDCGYGTQVENQESISTSSNEDEIPAKRPVHKKPQTSKPKTNNRGRSITLQERKRKKIVKRIKSNIINVKGLTHNTPTDDDISNILKEFTVDFLLKGYSSLINTLHNQILTNMQLEFDTSHFFWLITYFLKFATQIELNLEHVCSVLSYDIISYLTAEGVNLCEQFELAIKLDGNYLKPSIKRMHLVITAIREFVQAIEAYKKLTHICNDDKEILTSLQIKMCETEELRSMLLLLIRHYNPKYHSKQYLQDLVVTNHILLLFLDDVMKLPDYNGTTNMVDHIRQFATPEIMYQYGSLLEDFAENGEFVNDCIFTIMHHVGGELDSLITLFQPRILKTFTSIWKSEFEICDDWSDLIEYVINTFIKKPHTLQGSNNFRLKTENFEDYKIFAKPKIEPIKPARNKPNKQKAETDVKRKSASNNPGSSSNATWTEDELSSLSWNYMQSKTSKDMVGDIIKLFKEDDVIKCRDSVIRELFKQNLIKKQEFEKLLKKENDRNCKAEQANKETRENEIGKLCEQLSHDGKFRYLEWVQKVLLDTCWVKVYLDKKSTVSQTECVKKKNVKIMNFEIFKKKPDDLPAMSPVSYHSILFNRSIPLVPWNSEQAAICNDLKFLQLIHKLGFHMPVDSGKVFIRIPHFWTADFLYDMAGKILPIDTSKLKFSTKDISDSSISDLTQHNMMMFSDLTKDITVIATPENFYQIQKQKHFATMVNFTPMPGSASEQEGCESSKQNWLELVQKSHEHKLKFNLESPLIEDHDIEDELHPAKDKDVIIPPIVIPQPARGVPCGSPTIIPSLISVKQHTSTYNIQIEDPEYYNNSVCETASVASDLTRMYVSDEDEKSDIFMRPITPVNFLDD